MRDYETVVIIKPDVADNYLGTLSKKIEKTIGTKPGKLLKKDDWGLKRLAYEIQRQRKGRYLIFTYTQVPKALAELDKQLRFDENVIRYATFVKPPAPKHREKIKNKGAKSMPDVTPEPITDFPQTDHKLRDLGGTKKKGFTRRRLNKFSTDPNFQLDYKDVYTLSNFINEHGKIMPRRMVGNSARMHRQVSVAIKRARQLALMSYTDRNVSMPEEERRTQS